MRVTNNLDLAPSPPSPTNLVKSQSFTRTSAGRISDLETRLDLFDDPPPVTEAAEVAEDEDVMNEVVVIVDEEIPVFILRSFGRVAIRVLERGHAHEFLIKYKM